MTHTFERVNALAVHLGVFSGDIKKAENGKNVFEVDGREYAVDTLEDAAVTIATCNGFYIREFT